LVGWLKSKNQKYSSTFKSDFYVPMRMYMRRKYHKI